MSLENPGEDGERERWVADSDDMERREALAERVGSELKRDEQESGLSFFGGDDRYRVFSYSPAIVRKLLRHEHARVEWVYTAEGGEAKGREENLSEISLSEEGVEIEGVCAELPLGTLSIKGSPRQRDTPSGVVSTPSDARGVAAAFDEVDE